MIQIVAKQNGFRRCGKTHPSTPTNYKDGEWSAEDLAILKAETMLVVTEVADEDPAPGRTNATQTIALVNAAETLEALDAMAVGEDRKTVMAAIDAKRAALSA